MAVISDVMSAFCESFAIIGFIDGTFLRASVTIVGDVMSAFCKGAAAIGFLDGTSSNIGIGMAVVSDMVRAFRNTANFYVAESILVSNAAFETLTLIEGHSRGNARHHNSGDKGDWELHD